MRSLGYYKSQVYDKWGPTHKIMFWLTVIFGFLSLIFGGVIVLNIELDNSQVDIGNSSLDKSPICVGDNCEQNVYYSSPRENEEKLIISPNPKHITCGSNWSEEYSFKVTNNYDYGLYCITIAIPFNGTGMKYGDIVLEPDFEQKTIALSGEWDYGITSNWGIVEDTDTHDLIVLLIHINNMDPHTTLSYWTTISRGNCEGEFDLRAEIITKEKDSTCLYAG